MSNTVQILDSNFIKKILKSKVEIFFKSNPLFQKSIYKILTTLKQTNLQTANHKIKKYKSNDKHRLLTR